MFAGIVQLEKTPRPAKGVSLIENRGDSGNTAELRDGSSWTRVGSTMLFTGSYKTTTFP